MPLRKRIALSLRALMSHRHVNEKDSKALLEAVAEQLERDLRDRDMVRIDRDTLTAFLDQVADAVERFGGNAKRNEVMEFSAYLEHLGGVLDQSSRVVADRLEEKNLDEALDQEADYNGSVLPTLPVELSGAALLPAAAPIRALSLPEARELYPEAKIPGGAKIVSVAPGRFGYCSNHVPNDNGTKKAWCKHCNTPMVMDGLEWRAA